jgi:hypothetical protein
MFNTPVQGVLEAATNGLRNAFPDLFPLRSLRKRWCEYLPLVHHVSQTSAAHIAQRGELEANSMKGIRLFSMLPISSFAAKNIQLDTDGLAIALKSMGRKAALGDKGLWNRHFNTSVGGDGERRRFCHVIDTDGVSVSLHFEKPGVVAKDEELLEPKVATTRLAETRYANQTRDLDEGVRKAVIPDGIQRTIYIDPGGTTMAACILEGDCKEAPKTVNCGTAEYRHLSSMDRLRQKRMKLLKASGLEQVILSASRVNEFCV